MNIGESLPRNAQHFPQKLALVDAHRAVTYRELHERTNRLGNYLLAHGVGKGDLVGLSCGSRAEHFEIAVRGDVNHMLIAGHDEM